MKQKANIIQSTPYGYKRVFFLNEKARGIYFIIDDIDAAVIESGHVATADIRKNGKSIDPCITLNNKKIRLPKYIMGTDTSKEECDHINGITIDLRRCNLRNGTRLQNLLNTPNGVGKIIERGGKYKLVFPSYLNIDTSQCLYKTREAAEQDKYRILSSYEEFREWLYSNSQSISMQNETYEFVEDYYIDSWANTGTLGKIMNLSPAYEINARLRDMVVDSKSGRIPPDIEWQREMALKHEYREMIK